MRRWIVSPLVLLALGFGAGLFVLQLDWLGRLSPAYIYLPLAAGAAILAHLSTVELIRFECGTAITMRDHPRQLWLVYPCWLLSAAGLSGGHGAIIFLFPFAALGGVIVGNFAAISISARAAAQRAWPQTKA